MAVNDVSLTAGMRSNILSLQGTVALLNRTQKRLSTGQKVNTAVDNPVSFFASQALTSRASVIDSLKDAMGQAVQTITSADKGIKAITSMIEQAKGIAQSALSAPAPTSADVATGRISWSVIGADDSITIGGAAFTATSSGTPGADEFTVIGNGSIDMQSLADAINEHDWSGATNTFAASYNSGVVISSTVTATGGVRAVAAGDFSAAFAARSATMVLIPNWPGPIATGKTVGSITLTGAAAGNSLQIGNTTFTAVDGAPAAFNAVAHQGQFQVGANSAATMQNLVDAINAADTAYNGVWPTGGADSFNATFTDGTVILYRREPTGLGSPYLNCELSDFSGFSSSPATMSVIPPTIVYRSETLSLSGVQNGDRIRIEGQMFRAGNNFAVGATDAITAENLALVINASPGPKGINASAVTGSSISLISDEGILVNDVSIYNPSFTETMIADSTELSSLESQYNEMRDQITALAEDSGYKGKNLLSAAASLRTLTVQFEGATLAINGFNATASGLGLTAATWTSGGVIAADSTLLDAALNTLRQGSSRLAGNLSIITVRQDFSTNMINTLTEGSDKLTLADANEEGANMLMLQTRQSLSTTALSLSAQASQSVLTLFQ